MKLVRFITNDDGDKIEDSKWHLVTRYGDSERAVCTGEAFGEGESSALYQEKTSEKGGITCKKCIEIVKWFKAIKL